MKKKFKFEEYEVNFIILRLIEYRNHILLKDECTDIVDNLLLKMCR